MVYYLEYISLHITVTVHIETNWP